MLNKKLVKSSRFQMSIWMLGMFLCLLIVGYNFSHATVSKRSVAAQTSTVSNTTPSASSSQKGNDYLPINFDLLGDYDYTDPVFINGMKPSNLKSQIPEKVKSLDGKKVIIRGYFYPMSVVGDGTVNDFLLLRNQIYCCFGCAVRTNEWISVTMRNGK